MRGVREDCGRAEQRGRSQAEARQKRRSVCGSGGHSTAPQFMTSAVERIEINIKSFLAFVVQTKTLLQWLKTQICQVNLKLRLP